MAESLTVDERETMRALLDYANPQGLHPSEERWRDFSRVELSLRDERIRQLEKQCEVLAAEVDRMRPVVEAAEYYKRCNPYLPVSSSEKRLLESVVTYQASKPK